MSQTRVVAHRGFSGISPENTLVAFEKAIECGAEYFELDVHKSKDDSIVVIHDYSLDRTSSNGVSGEVATLSYPELREADVGFSQKFGDSFKNQRVPTLREALQLAKSKIKVCIEIKVYGVEKQVLKIVDELKMKNDVIIFSFHYPVIARIRQLDEEVQTLFLKNDANEMTVSYALAIGSNAIGVGPETPVDKDFLEMAHSNGLQVWKWTVNKEAEMKQLLEMKIDGLITDYPDKALKLVTTD